MGKNLKGELVLTTIRENIGIKVKKKEEFVVKTRTVIFSDKEQGISVSITKEENEHPLGHLTQFDVNDIRGTFTMKIGLNPQKKIDE